MVACAGLFEFDQDLFGIGHLARVGYTPPAELPRVVVDQALRRKRQKVVLDVDRCKGFKDRADALR
jgi:hypothetical protein